MNKIKQSIEGPWIFTIDNIFVELAREFPDNSFLIQNGVKPGSQNTAITPEMKAVAKKVLEMKDGELGSKELCATAGGCAVSTSRSANVYF